MKSSSFIVGTAEAILFLLLGIFLFILPMTALAIINYLAGGILVLSGIVALIRYATTKEGKQRILLIPQGFLGIIFGLMLIIGNMHIVALLLSYFIIFWFLASSITSLAASTCLQGALCIISILLNIFIIAISIWAFFSLWFSLDVFVFTLALLFIIVGIQKILFLLGERNSLKKGV